MADSDLAIVKNVNNPVPPVGSNVTFTIDTSNLGPADDTGVIVNDILPSGYGFVSATPTTGMITASPPPGGSGTITWSIGNFLTTDTPQLIIVATVLAPPNDYLNISIISGDNNDPNEENNSSSADVTPVPVPSSDLSIAKIGPNTANVGDTITFTITATNEGPDNDTGIVVTDVLPSGFGFVSATPTSGMITASPPIGSSGVITWSIGNMVFGDIEQLTLVVTVLSSPNDYQNTVTISGDNNDPNLSNNTASLLVDVESSTNGRGKSNGTGFFFPPTLCFSRKTFGSCDCPKEIRYPNRYGIIYILVSSDDTQCCYIIKR